MPPSADLPVQFGRYRILKKLGEGGMGAVYLAEDMQLGRQVALKVPRPDSPPEYVQRFLREARVAAQIDHPSICPIHDIGDQDGRPFFVMPYLKGRTLAAAIGERGLPVEQGVALVGELAQAVQHLHERGLMHRDLKPQNVMLKVNGHPVVMDFGLARTVGDNPQRLTGTGSFVGTGAPTPFSLQPALAGLAKRHLPCPAMCSMRSTCTSTGTPNRTNPS